MYRRFVKHNYVLSFIHCHGICVCIVFFTVNSSVNAAGSSCQRKFHTKAIKLKTFPQGYVISVCGVVVSCSLVELKVPGSSPTTGGPDVVCVTE